MAINRICFIFCLVIYKLKMFKENYYCILNVFYKYNYLQISIIDTVILYMTVKEDLTQEKKLT